MARVLDSLDKIGVEHRPQNNGSHRARCPVHRGTTTSSLSVVPKDGRAAVHCFGGCESDQILEILGLRVADLYDEAISHPDSERLHPYESASGRLVGVTMRRPSGKPGPKFLPNTRSTSGWELKSSAELKALPYRLPELITAITQGRTIHLTEGERDADTVFRLGGVATTNAHGADHLTIDHVRWLTNAHVIVVQDRDEAGRKRGSAAAELLVNFAASIRLVEPAAGKDLSDHVAEGGSLDTLVTVPLDIPTSAASDSAVLVSLNTVQPEALSWLWEGRLPAGKLVTIDGDPSVGKSTLAVDLAAHVSTGAPWPDGAPCPIGDVLILSAEDGLADTIRPRLDAAGGDPARVHALTAVRLTGEDGSVSERPPTLADIASIGSAIRSVSASLMVIDVMMAFLPGKVDSHKDQDIRAVLSRLTRLGEETGCTSVLLRHLNKTAGGSAMYRGGGSIGIVGAARAGYLIGRDPDDPDTRVMACVKSNLAREPSSLGYRLVSTPGSDVAHIEWTGESAHDATGLLRVDHDDADNRDEIGRLLESILCGGPVEAKEVSRQVRAAGFSVDQAKRAKRRLGVRSEKAGMGDGWVWTLPVHAPEGSTEGSEESGSQEPPPSLPSRSLRSAAEAPSRPTNTWRVSGRHIDDDTEESA